MDADDPDERLVTASHRRVRHRPPQTPMAVNGSKYLPPSAEEKEGLVNKWPFDAEKKTYPYWDGLLGEAVDATYDGTETIDGLETYRYHVLVEDAPTEVIEGVDGVYSQDKYIWIDPVTGSIINQTQHEVRELEDGSTLLDLQLAFTEDQVAANAEDAEDNGSTLGPPHRAPCRSSASSVGASSALLTGIALPDSCAGAPALHAVSTGPTPEGDLDRMPDLATVHPTTSGGTPTRSSGSCTTWGRPSSASGRSSAWG